MSINPLIKQNKNEQMVHNLVSDALMSQFKSLNKDKKFPMFHECLNNIFGDQLNNENFLEWLSPKLEIRPSKFKKYVAKWREFEQFETNASGTI